MTSYTTRLTAAPAVRRPNVHMGDVAGTSGAITLNDRYLSRNGKPWFPVMGEYHFSRDRTEAWETELRKIKAGGVDVLATYVIWILHEEQRGQVRWDGNRDLRRFIELAASIGLSVLLRIGPWAHGEARNGGFPDWLQELPVGHRTNDPAYLDLVVPWYREIAAQVKGLFHSEENPDGPIIGIQVDNELYDQPDHLKKLRELAEDAGMHATLWVATGWGGAQLPADDVMPVYAGYSDGFWEESTTGWPAFGVMHFTFNSERDDLSVGADLRRNDAAVPADRDYRYPFVTCELGGGMHVAYHRRPLVDPEDVSALALTKLGSGSAWQGYYLYHGVTQQAGELSSMQESHASNYPSDLPERDYDFFAPIGLAGQLRDHYHLLRRQHLLLRTYGSDIATLPAVIPDQEPTGARWALRGDEKGGYLFVNNHQPAIAQLPELDGIQFTIELDTTTVTLPQQPTTIPSGSHFIWPLRRAFGTIPALSGTVQPVTEIATANGPLVVFSAIDGIPPELVIEGVPAEQISGARVTSNGDGTVTAVPLTVAGPECTVQVGMTTVLVLDERSSRQLWREDLNGTDSLIIWSGGLLPGVAPVLETTEARSTLLVLPALAGQPNSSVRENGTVGPFAAYTVTGPDELPALKVEPERVAGGTVPVRTGGSNGRYSAPTDEDYAAAAARLRLRVPAGVFENAADRVIARIDWTGDVARATIAGALISDQFWSGRAWDIELNDSQDRLVDGILIEAFPWGANSPVYVDPRVRPAGEGSTLDIRDVSVVRTRSIPIWAAN